MNPISDFIGQIESNPWLSISSFIVTVLSALLAIFFYVKSKRAKKPRYAKRSINIIMDLVSRIESLEILYEGQAIENLTVSKVAFWNAGSDTIHNHDIASADPVMVKVKNGCKILKSHKVYEKNPANKFDIHSLSDDSQLHIVWEYVDKDEGAIFQLFHTGTSNQDVIVQGRIKGAGVVTEWKPSRLSYSPFGRVMRLTMIVSLIIIPIIVPILIFSFPGVLLSKEGVEEISFLEGLSTFIFTILIYWPIAYYLLTRSMPKGFDAFTKDDFISEIKDK